MAAWSNPEVFRTGCFSSQRYIKVWVIVDVLDQFQDMVEGSFFGFCLITWFYRSFWYLKMLVVKTERYWGSTTTAVKLLSVYSPPE